MSARSSHHRDVFAGGWIGVIHDILRFAQSKPLAGFSIIDEALHAMGTLTEHCPVGQNAVDRG